MGYVVPQEIELYELVAKNAIKNILKNIIKKDTVITREGEWNYDPESKTVSKNDCELLEDYHKEYVSFVPKHNYPFTVIECFCVGNNKKLHESILHKYYKKHNPIYTNGAGKLYTLSHILNYQPPPKGWKLPRITHNKDINEKLNILLNEELKNVLDEKLYNYLLMQCLLEKTDKNLVVSNTKFLLTTIWHHRYNKASYNKKSHESENTIVTEIIPVLSVSKSEILEDYAVISHSQPKKNTELTAAMIDGCR